MRLSRQTVDAPADARAQVEDLIGVLRTPADLDPLLERARGARCVLLGEASHGTADHYRWRAEVTKRLVAECGFSFVAVEGDWPDCLEVSCWAKGFEGPDRSAEDVLGTFRRWPTWMWANREVADFLTWLRDHNRGTGREVGFYGLDVYSLWESLDRVAGYLREQRPESLPQAEAALRCFEPYGEDPQRYAFSTRLVPEGCEAEVVALLREVQRLAGERRDRLGPDAELDARQSAEVVAGAEAYYRAMVRADAGSWNLRDTHMADTLDRLLDHHGPSAKAVVWAHNTHVGDARATDMADAGMVNLGQLARERHGEDAVLLVGFSAQEGSVIAGARWGARMQRMSVPPSRRGSHESLISEVTREPALFVFPEDRSGPWLDAWFDHRAIGVVYDPRRDPLGNWVPTRIGQRYDAFLSFGTTDAVHPLHLEPQRDAGERDTYPWSA